MGENTVVTRYVVPIGGKRKPLIISKLQSIFKKFRKKLALLKRL